MKTFDWTILLIRSIFTICNIVASHILKFKVRPCTYINLRRCYLSYTFVLWFTLKLIFVAFFASVWFITTIFAILVAIAIFKLIYATFQGTFYRVLIGGAVEWLDFVEKSFEILDRENQNRIPDRSVHMNWSGAHWLVHLLFFRIWFPRHEHVTLCSRSIWQISEQRWSSHWERKWSISRWSSPRESTTNNEVKPWNIGWFQSLFWQSSFLNSKKIRTKFWL